MSKRFRPQLMPTLGYLILCPLLVSLGVWQLDRREQKQTRFDAYQAQRNAAPVRVTSFGPDETEAALWRPVVIHGNFDKRVVLLDNRTVNAQLGYEVLQALELEDSSYVLVNLGFIPAPPRRDTLPVVPEIASAAGVAGFIGPEPVTGLVFDEASPLDQLHDGVWRAQRIELDSLSGLLSLTLRPYVVYLTAEDGTAFHREWPTPGNEASRHHAYAVQWFAMALVLTGLFIFLQRKEINDE